MRLFIAVFPPPEVQSVAAQAAAALAGGESRVSWVRAVNLHYTLRFLGERDASLVTAVAEAMRETARQHRAFGAALGGFGAFPSAERARVLWLGLAEGAEAMREVAATLERALATRGLEPAEHPFTPHLTLGRPRTASDWTSHLAAAAPTDRFRVDRLRLIRSVPGPGGSRYEVAAEAGLGAVEAQLGPGK